jgi:hypothetical protein
VTVHSVYTAVQKLHHTGLYIIVVAKVTNSTDTTLQETDHAGNAFIKNVHVVSRGRVVSVTCMARGSQRIFGLRILHVNSLYLCCRVPFLNPLSLCGNYIYHLV